MLGEIYSDGIRLSRRCEFVSVFFGGLK